MDADTSTEATALLGPEPNVPHVPASLTKRVIVVALITVIVVDFGSYLMDAPHLKILEDTICDRYYGDHPNPPHRRDCTSGPVQAELALITQLLETFNIIPDLLVSIPFGMLADRRGRRFVLLVSMSGLILQDTLLRLLLWRPDLFPPRLVWISPLTRFMGGGTSITTSMIHLTIADVVSADQRANFYFLLAACITAGNMVGTPLGAFFMRFNPWVPYVLSVWITAIGGLAIPFFFLPETLGFSKRQSGPPPAHMPGPASGSSTTKLPWTSARVLSGLKPLRQPAVFAVCFAYCVASVASRASSFLMQYFRQNFSLSYEKASLILSIRGAITLAMLIVLLPALNRVLSRYGFGAQAKDLFISRLSIFFYSAGSMVIATSPVISLATAGVAVFSLGGGFSAVLRSFAASLVQPDESGLLFSALATAHAFGMLLAGPVIAGSFNWGIKHHWSGVAFLFVGTLFASGLLALCLISSRNKLDDGEDAEERAPEEA